jgi:predicted DNA-binding transcriptional regulator
MPFNMKTGLLIIALILTALVSVYGQDDIVVKEYSVHKKRGPFFLRWYWNVRQIETTVYHETLTLMSNGQFEREVVTSCAWTKYFGTWRKHGNRVILEIDRCTIGKTTIKTIEYQSTENTLVMTAPEFLEGPPHLRLRN